MQIQNVRNSGANTNFGQIKSINFSRLYKKYPEYGKKLINSLKQNETAMEFCKKYDVNIVFDAYKSGNMLVESGIHIFYENPALSKFKKMIKSFFGNEEKVHIIGFGNSMDSATKELINRMKPEEKRGSGVLTSHIKIADEKIQSELNSKKQKAAEKLWQETIQTAKRNKKDCDQENLNKAVDDLINYSI